jgi:Fe-S-cluster containining protein
MPVTFTASTGSANAAPLLVYPGRLDTTPLPECLRCGACCFSTLERYAPVTGDDYSRLGDHAEENVRFIGNRAFMRLVDGHCRALRVDGAGQFACSVYEQRPEICRELQRGSPACAGERALKGDRPLTALRTR